MNIIITKTFEKQKNNFQKVDAFLDKIKDYKNLDNMPHGLYFKKFNNTSENVFTFRLNESDRIIASLYSKGKNLSIDRELNESNNKEPTFIFHYISVHDRQNDFAKKVSDDYEIIDYIQSDYKEIKKIEESLSLDEDKNLFMKWSGTNKPLKPILTKDKDEIIESFLRKDNEKTMLLSGCAGSGKTEMAIEIIRRLYEENKNTKILYITYSLPLAEEIKSRFIISNSNISFLTIGDLVNTGINFEDIKTFKSFVESIKSNGHYKSLYSFITKREMDIYYLYSEIHGLIMGYMNKNFDRVKDKLISKEEYQEISNDIKTYTKLDDIKIVYKIAQEYQRYLDDNNIYSLSYESLILSKTLQDSDKYDYIICDETQDFTETMLVLVKNLLKENSKGKILFSYDENQTIQPTSFRENRLQTLMGIVCDSKLTDNFRNSKSVTEFVNNLNKIREKKIPKNDAKNYREEIARNNAPGNIYFYNGSIETLRDLIDSSNTAVITPEDTIKLAEKLFGQDSKEKAISIRKIEDVKGLEFPTIIVYNIITFYKDIFDKISKQKDGRLKDYTYSYYFNLFYVAITRGLFNIILVEDYKEYFYNDIFLPEYSVKTDILDISSLADKTSEGYFKQAEQFFKNQDYKYAKIYYQKGIDILEEKTDFDKEKVAKEIEISKIYCDYKDNKLTSQEAINIFIEKNYYTQAAEIYKSIGNMKEYCAMIMLAEHKKDFPKATNWHSIDVEQAYGKNNIYDKEVGKLLEIKNKNLNKTKEDISKIIGELNDITRTN